MIEHEHLIDCPHCEAPITKADLAKARRGDHKEVTNKFKKYRRTQIAEMRPYEPGEELGDVSISAPDRKAGSPKKGDMIARNPKNHDDQWLVAAAYFADNFESL